MIAATMLVFAATEATPGSVARKILGQYASEQQVEILKETLNLNDPAPVRYLRWAGVALGVIPDPLSGEKARKLGFDENRGGQYFGNFGYSQLYKLPVTDVLWSRLLNSLWLAGIAFAIIVPLSIVLGVIAGMNEGGKVDRIISLGSMITTSIPEFAWAIFLIAVFAVAWQMLPGTSPLSGGGWSTASQMILPVAVLVLVDFGYVARMVRAAVVEVMERPYIRTAVLKGLSTREVVVRHVLRNAMIAPFTIILLQINFLITGVVVTEVAFAYPGFGRMLLEAALFGDIAIIEAATLVAVVIAISTQLLGDVGYMLLNPRIRVS